MSILRFGYSLFHNTKAPVVPIEIWGAGYWHKVWVYVDSGASFTVLHTFEARRLGVKLNRCRKLMMAGPSNRRIPVYLKRVKMKIGRTRFSTEIGFCRTLGGAFNLLGRQQVFDKFDICFSDRKHEITFRRSS